MLENTEGEIKKVQPIETGNKRYTRRRNTKQKQNTTFAGHHHTQANTKKRK